MIKTIALVSAAIAFATLGASAVEAKNNPKFQAEMMKVAMGEDIPPAVKSDSSAPDSESVNAKKTR